MRFRFIFTTSPTSNGYNEILNQVGVENRLASFEYIKDTENFLENYTQIGLYQSPRARVKLKGEK